MRSQLFAQVGNVRFNHVGVVLPGEVIEMLQKSFLRDNDARFVDQVFQNAVFRR